MKSTFFLLFSFLLLFTQCSSPQTSTLYSKQSPVLDPPENQPPADPASFQRAILKEVNAWRQNGCKCGGKKMAPTHPLTWNEQLRQAAEDHAIDIASRQVLDHTGKDGSQVWDRVTKTGYSWQTVAENIAYGYWDIKSVIQGWVDSKGHCLNMMNPDYHEVGIAQEKDYWVMVLAKGL